GAAAAGPGAARARLRSLARVAVAATRIARPEDTLELVGGRDLELVVAAVLRALVRTPAEELGGVAEPRPLHVVVRDLAGPLGAQRLPAQILAAIPATGRAGKPLPLGARFLLGHGPVAPRMALERVRAQRRQLGHQLLAHRVGEGGGDAHVVQRVLVVVQAEQERADHRAGAFLVPAEPGP